MAKCLDFWMTPMSAQQLGCKQVAQTSYEVTRPSVYILASNSGSMDVLKPQHEANMNMEIDT
jgi:hypothetical protein